MGGPNHAWDTLPSTHKYLYLTHSKVHATHTPLHPLPRKKTHTRASMVWIWVLPQEGNWKTGHIGIGKFGYRPGSATDGKIPIPSERGRIFIIIDKEHRLFARQGGVWRRDTLGVEGSQFFKVIRGKESWEVFCFGILHHLLYFIEYHGTVSHSSSTLLEMNSGLSLPRSTCPCLSLALQPLAAPLPFHE